MQVEYEVKEGDTLSEIIYSMTGNSSSDAYNEIARQNNIEDANRIMPGQKIVFNANDFITDSYRNSHPEISAETNSNQPLKGNSNKFSENSLKAEAFQSNPFDGQTPNQSVVSETVEVKTTENYQSNPQQFNQTGVLFENSSTTVNSNSPSSEDKPFDFSSVFKPDNKVMPNISEIDFSKPLTQEFPEITPIPFATSSVDETQPPSVGKNTVPSDVINTVANAEIVKKTIETIFNSKRNQSPNYTYSPSMYEICYIDNVYEFVPTESFKNFVVKESAGEEFVEVNNCVKKCCEDIDGIISSLNTLNDKMGINTGTTEQIKKITSSLSAKKQDLIKKNQELIEACYEVIQYVYENKSNKAQEASAISSTISRINIYKG